jgi:isopentenyl diphosphate isomerase/L-lactate dehydrogenase-like FMN-dependent dehydrogenase
VARSIVTLGKEDVVVVAALKRLVERDGLTHELLLNLAEAVETRLQLEVVVGVGLGNGRDNGDVVALGADVVGR